MRCELWRWLRSVTPIFWAERIKELGGTEPQFSGNPNGQADSLANRVGGADLGLRRLGIDEGRDIAKYGKQIKELGGKPSIVIFEEVIGGALFEAILFADGRILNPHFAQ